MIESLVQWTLLNNSDKLGEMLNFNINKIIAREYTTKFGRIDFILANNNNENLIVELETELNTKSKLNYCFGQILDYRNVELEGEKSYCILYAEETQTKQKQKIKEFGEANNISIKTYSLETVKSLYSETIERLSLNVGLALPNPKNYTICYLRWLNKIMKTFLDLNKDILTKETIAIPFTSNTNFSCYERIALDFELFIIRDNKYVLTDNGKIFIENMNPLINSATNIPSVDLTNEQKRLLLKVLTNGIWENKIHKVNIYWFLRFIEVTHGNWLPKGYDFEKSKLDIVNGFFNVTYKSRTMYEFLKWCSNYCIELGLIEIMKSTSLYDQITLTPLGIEVNNIFSMDLTLKKSRMNLNFKFIE
ncbi:MAG: hypothetical protein H6Q16_782 [Bacteroidetes bacterium]|nr:hypothetical protein [Bacteroidota bacterium]